ncbi:MAG: ubiquitin-conjugating enzyme E2 [Desulfopila sp.]|jgi:ubiquitin-protein ligase|nr:ubiquitin-conjugating enzyme E2 [Desulfopila sp.]
MSQDDKRLISDHKEVVDTIRRYKNITLVNTAGEPVNEYDIEYKVQGYTIAKDGTITISKVHRIKIKIPFGYPHFPPTIKPLSPIFHPEIDDHVLPIANYWEENKSLSALVLHIGNMICGNVNSTEQPFNLEAALYYEKHKSRLPLDSLKPVEEKSKTARRHDPGSNLVAPLLSAALILFILVALGGGSLFLYEKWKLSQAQTLFQSAESHRAEEEFHKAQEKAEASLNSLGKIFLLRPDHNAFSQKIERFLQSEIMVQGLQGNVRYGDTFIRRERVQQIEFVKELVAYAEQSLHKEDLQTALSNYRKALEYATAYDLQTELLEIRRSLAELELEILISESEKARQNKDWENAVALHENILAFIDENRSYLPEPSEQAARTSQLLLIDRISLHSREADQAEAANDLAAALQHHNALIDLIGKAQSQNSSTLKDTLSDSIHKVAVLTERITIERQRKWLLDNFREIFQIHYPTVLPSTLRSPQALFIKYDENNMVFSLSCLEKSSGSIVRLRVFYQYDTLNDRWTIYSGEIEENS